MVATARVNTPISKADKKHGYRMGCEGYMTIADAAAHVSVSKKTVTRWLQAGYVQHVKMDPKVPKSAVRVCRRSLDEFLATRGR